MLLLRHEIDYAAAAARFDYAAMLMMPRNALLRHAIFLYVAACCHTQSRFADDITPCRLRHTTIMVIHSVALIDYRYAWLLPQAICHAAVTLAYAADAMRVTAALRRRVLARRRKTTRDARRGGSERYARADD